ncbi:helix-turn-helix domain-containing protein [Thiofilum flexile]|uniref:helix-turn-helix domain-containing protein n=1 Tax=Thiofilum flexile TaxID=125627 RepID=UPI00037B4FFC|nr:helix-turn-helix domain-containing protein [Thiofilum flexile]
MNDVPHYFLYGKTAAIDSTHHLAITRLEESLPKHQWEIHPHRHDHLHQLLVLETGSVLAKIHDQHYEEKAGCIIYVPAREVHGFTHHPSVQGYILTINAAFLSGLFAESEHQALLILLSRPLLLNQANNQATYERLFGLIQQLLSEYESDQLGKVSILGSYLKIILILLSRNALPLAQSLSPSNYKITLYERFLDLLEQNYLAQWGVNQYANALGLTENRLNRLCQRYTGQNTLQLIHGRLMLEAKRRLIYTNSAISTLAYELGFKDPAYFTRFFTRHSAGTSPSQFKLQWHQNH